MPVDSPTDILPVDGPPPWPDANHRLLYGAGAWLDPLKRLSTFEPGDFETFVLQWVNGYLAHKYHEVQRRGAAGDKGRDIVAWIDPPGTPNRRWDLYQCKHYKDALAPSEFHLEVAKLCFYVHRGDYAMPQSYYVLTHKGVGNTLQDLIDEPLKLRDSLKEYWNAQCATKIMKGANIPLTGSLLAFVDAADFSIIHSVSPSDLIAQHSETRYHSFVFGVQLKPRPPVPLPPDEPASKETKYVNAMYCAFAEHLGKPVATISAISSHAYLRSSFDHARVCFYSAESLKEFSRETWPDDSCFNSIADTVHQGVKFVMAGLHADGFHRMIAVCAMAISVQIDPNNAIGNPLPNDRVGICHQLANEGTIRWVNTNG
jgi:hypothetical protein